MDSDKRRPIRHAVLIGCITFGLTIIFSLLSQGIISELNSIIVSIVMLLLIIFVGIIADVVGTAAAATSVVPLHSKAANKVRGAHHAIFLAKKADKVANICNDVIGDIVGTLSGALGIAVVAQILTYDVPMDQKLLSTLVTGLIASLTVGGKAFGKKFAIEQSDKVIFTVGKIWSLLETVFHTDFLNRNNKRDNKNDNKTPKKDVKH